MKDFYKVIEPIHCIFCTIRFEDGVLSISGVDRPYNNGDCGGACGQISDVIRAILINTHRKLYEGWNEENLEKFLSIWNDWHLNDMFAGSPAQTLELELSKHTYTGTDWYGWACRTLEEAGLLVDNSYLHKGKPYEFGSAWLRREVPQEVLDFLLTLPDTANDPAWV